MKHDLHLECEPVLIGYDAGGFARYEASTEGTAHCSCGFYIQGERKMVNQQGKEHWEQFIKPA